MSILQTQRDVKREEGSEGLFDSDLRILYEK